MLRVLTDDRLVRGQLSVLIRDLGYQLNFHDNGDALLSQISIDSNTTTAVLLDVQLSSKETLNKVLSTLGPNVRKIGFQALNNGNQTTIDSKPNGFDYFFLLPANAERAKARLKIALRSERADANERSQHLTPAPLRFTRTSVPFGKTRNPFSRQAPLRSESKDSRYIQAYSSSVKNIISQFNEIKISAPLIIIAGNEGSEFEAFAREFNFQANGDKTQLIILDDDNLSLEKLEAIEKKATKSQKPCLCYLGRTDALNADSIEAVSLFVEFLNNLRNPNLRMIIAHEYGTEDFLAKPVLEFVKKHHNQSPTLLIPTMKDRVDDIIPIALNLLNTLRVAHPFLQVKSISESALNYLLEQRAELSEAKLIRILRNSIALSQRTTLEVEDFKNYGEHSATTSHLLESMADETYFPSSQTA